MKTVFLLLVIYQIKHFLADYPLQGKYMLGKFAKYPDYVFPLLAHVGVHGAFTLVIAAAFGCHYAPWLALIDMVLHFIMDRIKASPDMLGRFQAISKSEYVEHMQHVQKFESLKSPRHPEIELHLKNSKRDFAVKMRSNVFFWWSLGFDQLFHHLTDLLLCYIIVMSTL